MYNAKDIMQDLKYVSTEEKKKSNPRENEILLQVSMTIIYLWTLKEYIQIITISAT